ncbi:MAG: cytochrome c biogenesis CcdA family protein [Coriobacteriales bacterium]|nr:cytochrome c biogenesis CcdA family protein [Coriobacteriaceae bacterium]MDY2722377.1 cytochrome c biogenesis CcdA family protein [Coriobacteriales bacterium]MDY5661917.1 cytochrome c biogenesis CcdA family protein [Coriobacteriales bacterium]
MDIAAFVSAFGAGLLSFFSPCILPLLPVYVGILTTGADDEQLGLARRCANTVAFVLGICLVFVALGVGASALGSVFNNPYVTIALGIVVFAFGLVLAGFVKIPLLQRDSRKGLRRVKVRGVASAFLLGLAFSFGWTPCSRAAGPRTSKRPRTRRSTTGEASTRSACSFPPAVTSP